VPGTRWHPPHNLPPQAPIEVIQAGWIGGNSGALGDDSGRNTANAFFQTPSCSQWHCSPSGLTGLTIFQPILLHYPSGHAHKTHTYTGAQHLLSTHTQPVYTHTTHTQREGRAIHHNSYSRKLLTHTHTAGCQEGSSRLQGIWVKGYGRLSRLAKPAEGTIKGEPGFFKFSTRLEGIEGPKKAPATKKARRS
jgi:hypothetical protein